MFVVRGLGLALQGLVFLFVIGLPLIGLFTLFTWGLILILTAQPVNPVAVAGAVSDAVDIYDGATYVRTEFRLENDQRVFASQPGLEPPLARGHPASGDVVTVWVSPGIDWFQISRTDVMAISVAPESRAEPGHASWGFRHRDEQAVRERLIGFGLVATVGLVIGLGTLWDRVSGKRGSPSALDDVLRTHRGLAGRAGGRLDA